MSNTSSNAKMPIKSNAPSHEDPHDDSHEEKVGSVWSRVLLEKRKSLPLQGASELDVLKPVSLEAHQRTFIQGLIDKNLAHLIPGLKKGVGLTTEMGEKPYWRHLLSIEGGLDALVEHYPQNRWSDFFKSVFKRHSNTQEFESLTLRYQAKYGDWPKTLLTLKKDKSYLFEAPHVYSWVKKIWLVESGLTKKTSLTDFLKSLYHLPRMQVLLSLGLSEEEYEKVKTWAQTHSSSMSTPHDTRPLALIQCVHFVDVQHLKKEPWREALFNHVFKDDYRIVTQRADWDKHWPGLRASIEAGELQQWGIGPEALQASATDRLMAAQLVDQDTWFDPDVPQSILPSAMGEECTPERLEQWNETWFGLLDEKGGIAPQMPSEEGLSPSVKQWVLLAQWVKMQVASTVGGAVYWMHKHPKGMVPQANGSGEWSFRPWHQARNLSTSGELMYHSWNNDGLARVIHRVMQSGHWKNPSSQALHPSWAAWCEALERLYPMVKAIESRYTAQALDQAWGASGSHAEDPSKIKKRL